MLTDLLQTSYFAIFLIVALGFMLGRIKVMGLSLDVSAVIFIALAFGHWGVSIPKELGTFGLVLFIFTIGIQAGPGFFHSFRSKGKTLILITLLIVASACLTRALYKEPEILIFDEATSSLDSISERYVKQTLDALARKGKTIIVIAHRLSTVKNADKIVVIDKGQVIEAGTHEELFNSNGMYHRLWKEQFDEIG